jgi:hypothetical protein
VAGGGWKWKGWRLLAVARSACIFRTVAAAGVLWRVGGGGGETAKLQVKSHEKLDQIVI